MKKKRFNLIIVVMVVCLFASMLTGCSGISEADLQEAYSKGYNAGYEEGKEIGFEEARSEYLDRLERLCNSIGDPETFVEDYRNGAVTIYDVADFLEYMKEELWDMVCG